MKVVSFRADLDLLELLDRYAMNHGLPRSEVIRKAIEDLVKGEVK
ncbi:CopG family transcriptional regulator [Acidianus manzaensis]|uniref:CopG family transcriptional regulator n=1 Tax=Acidianus manzaensis TaxID=282676 RepID=A0A1W6K1K7_9CREN|nr:ribbon-helix-helix protein, CopG family [Acidianus manzaensis]ARM76377.1 CopG family transcriptional regulator [Acidianus manzaensis]